MEMGGLTQVSLKEDQLSILLGGPGGRPAPCREGGGGSKRSLEFKRIDNEDAEIVFDLGCKKKQTNKRRDQGEHNHSEEDSLAVRSQPWV